MGMSVRERAEWESGYAFVRHYPEAGDQVE